MEGSLTAEEKFSIARFLDLAGDYLRDGYARDHNNSGFEDDKPPMPTDSESPAKSESDDFSSLPLAYQMDEDGEEPEDGGTRDFTRDGTNDHTQGNTLEDIAAAIRSCNNCPLSAKRTHAVPGEGSGNPLVMVIGEGPGEEEDATGRPFVGRAGQLLDRMLASIGLSRDRNCYIANMVKCRPPGNRDPEPAEISACFHFLEKQIALLKPRVILCAGRVAAQNLLKTGKGINSLRGSFTEFRITTAAENGAEETVIPVLCTFHPSFILRDESMKRPAWEDLKLLKSRLGSPDDT